jgi:hypothetical protein
MHTRQPAFALLYLSALLSDDAEVVPPAEMNCSTHGASTRCWKPA